MSVVNSLFFSLCLSTYSEHIALVTRRQCYASARRRGRGGEKTLTHKTTQTTTTATLSVTLLASTSHQHAPLHACVRVFVHASNESAFDFQMKAGPCWLCAFTRQVEPSVQRSGSLIHLRVFQQTPPRARGRTRLHSIPLLPLFPPRLSASLRQESTPSSLLHSDPLLLQVSPTLSAAPPAPPAPRPPGLRSIDRASTGPGCRAS